MIRRATIEDLTELARLFDAYRQFYQQDPDFAVAQGYIRERILADESVIFVAEADNRLAGFCQLYPTFCSVAAQPMLVLYDLYVDSSSRRSGQGKALMLAAQSFGAAAGFCRLELATAIDNLAGQALYEALGWQRDSEFFHYSLELSV